MDKLLRRMEQDRKRSRDEFERMKQRVDFLGCVSLGFLTLAFIVCVALIVFSMIFFCK